MSSILSKIEVLDADPTNPELGRIWLVRNEEEDLDHPPDDPVSITLPLFEGKVESVVGGIRIQAATHPDEVDEYDVYTSPMDMHEWTLRATDSLREPLTLTVAHELTLGAGYDIRIVAKNHQQEISENKIFYRVGAGALESFTGIDDYDGSQPATYFSQNLRNSGSLTHNLDDGDGMKYLRFEQNDRYLGTPADCTISKNQSNEYNLDSGGATIEIKVRVQSCTSGVVALLQGYVKTGDQGGMFSFRSPSSTNDLRIHVGDNNENMIKSPILIEDHQKNTISLESCGEWHTFRFITDANRNLKVYMNHNPIPVLTAKLYSTSFTSNRLSVGKLSNSHFSDFVLDIAYLKYKPEIVDTVI